MSFCDGFVGVESIVLHFRMASILAYNGHHVTKVRSNREIGIFMLVLALPEMYIMIMALSLHISGLIAREIGMLSYSFNNPRGWRCLRYSKSTRLQVHGWNLS